MKIVRTRRGVRLVDGPDLVSHLRATPGPTHGFFDVLAACVVAFAPEDGPRRRVLLLGFAVGGVVAPIRGAGWTQRIDAVDLSHDSVPLFEEIAAAWAGDVRIDKADAAVWLRRHRTRWDVIVEDLTVRGKTCAIKPAVSVDTLPELMHDRLAAAGVAATNVLPVPGFTWDALLVRLAAPYDRALVVHCDDYENRILLAGPGVPAARQTAARLRQVLGALGSRQASRFSVQLLRRSRSRSKA
jgi:hypothetical protein